MIMMQQYSFDGLQLNYQNMNSHHSKPKSAVDTFCTQHAANYNP
jgi:hypothetical protein